MKKLSKKMKKEDDQFWQILEDAVDKQIFEDSKPKSPEQENEKYLPKWERKEMKRLGIDRQIMRDVIKARKAGLRIVKL